jgi:hypothetical protein
MVQMSNKFLAFILGVAVASVAATPVARQRGNCGKRSYGPFKLFATAEDDLSDQSPLKLITTSTSENGDITSVLSVRYVLLFSTTTLPCSLYCIFSSRLTRTFYRCARLMIVALYQSNGC